MKNFLKNASLIIITLLSTVLVGINDVSAAMTCEEALAQGYSCKSTEHGDWIATGTYKKDISTTMLKNPAYKGKLRADYKLAIYQNDVDNNKDYVYYTYNDNYGSTDYCLDADKSSIRSMYIHRFLLDPYNNKSPNIYLHDVAIMEVLTSVGQPAPKTTENIAASIAIRALNHLFGLSNNFENTNAPNDWVGSGIYNKAYIGIIYKWAIKDEYHSEVKEAYDVLEAKLAANYNFRSKTQLEEIMKNAGNYRFSDNGGTTLQKARELFNSGLLAAAKAADTTELANIEKPLSGETLNNGVQKVSDEIGEKSYLDMKYTFKLSNFTNDGKAEFKIDNLLYNDGFEKVGAISEPRVIYVGDDAQQVICDEEMGSSCDGIIGKNLLEGMTMVEEKNLIVIIRFEGYTSLKNDDNKTPILNCGQQPMDWTLNYSYKDTNMVNLYPDYVGQVWYAYGSNSQKINTAQRYISVVKAKDGGQDESYQTDSLTGEIILKEECNCSALKEACIATDDIKSDECKDFFDAGCGVCDELKVKCDIEDDEDACEEYSNTCDFTCDTFVDSYQCCDSNDDLIVSTLDDKEVSILGPGPNNPDADIKACFVNNVDKQRIDDEKGYSNIAGVKDQKENNYTSYQLADNKYCSVSCKEDYVMTMPTAKMVNAGRYFTFKAKVEGTKTCYTNTIDREQYKKDIIEAQDVLIKAYNEYQYWKAASAAPRLSPLLQCYNCTAAGSSGPAYHYVSTTAPKVEYYIEETNGGYGDNIVVTNYNARQSVYERSENDNSCGGCITCPCKSTPGQPPCKPSTACPQFIYNGTLENLNNIIDTNFAKAEKDLENAETKYKEIIEEFQECTDDIWTSEMNYDAKVYYNYEENYLNKFGLIGEMDEQIVSQNTDIDWFCRDDEINNDYDACKTGAKSDKESTQATKKYIYCTKDECYEERDDSYRLISEANFVSRTSNIEISYKPKTLFYNVYPSGEITDSKADDNVALENSLPVSLNTDRGIYKYTVNIENLGEFYDDPTNDNLGRYVGANTAVVDPNTLVYNCAYLVNIVEKEGWTCDFTDTCTDDCITECKGPNCGDDNYCKNADCIHECIGLGCIYDTKAGSSILEKVVSLNNLFPNGTNSYNWNQKVNEKAEDTVSEIESAGNTIYDEQPILSVTINGSTAAAIRKHNKEVENEGGYSNRSLDCYAIDGYEEIACYSRFITEVMEGTRYGSNIVNDKSKVKDIRKPGDNNMEYFTLWDGEVDELKMLGPSYK